MTATMTARNATLQDLAALLHDQQGRKLDLVAHARHIRAENGMIRLSGSEATITDEGVSPDGLYRPTEVCDEGIAAKLGIPLAYLRRMREQKPALYDRNVNGWLEDADRNYLVRCFRGGGGEGIARALLSDQYRIIDHLDILTSALEGLQQAGIGADDIDKCDLTDRRMYVRVVCEGVSVLAPLLLAGYRSPFSGQEGKDCPVVSAGFVLSNSETGGGRFTIAPRLAVKVCKNGMVIDREAVSRQHLGARLDEGIQWSDETLQKNLELVASQTRDAVAGFLSKEYLEAKVAELEGQAAVPVTEPMETVKEVGKKLQYSDEQTMQVLRFFFKSDQHTAGGVMQAVTASAQRASDGDMAAKMESDGIRAMAIAAAYNS